MILLTGATGTLGRVIHRRLLELGEPVRGLSRAPGPGLIQGDLMSGQGIAAAVEGVSTIVHCATSRRGEVAAARTLLLHADAAAHLVYISIVGVDRIPISYYRSKLETELLVQESGLPWTILRATQFHDLIYLLFHAQRRLPLLAVPDMSVQPIDAAAVAERMVELARGEPAGRVPDIGGPQVRTARSLAQAYLEATGRRRRIVKARLPGKAFAAIRAGANLVPGNPVGTVNFEEYLRNRQS